MDSTILINRTGQLKRFINNLWQHQQKNEFCDFTFVTNSISIECHKLVLSSASTYFSELLCDSEHNTYIIDVTPLPEHILRTVVAFMYNKEYVIDDKNVIELLKLSRTWNLDILAKLCVTYMNNNITISNACMLFSFALETDSKDQFQLLNEFIREHFESLYRSNRLRELSLDKLMHIIKHDEIAVKNEDLIFSSAAQIINQQTPLEDINRCLELIRFPHTTADFLLEVIQGHPLMKEPHRTRYVQEALKYQLNGRSTKTDKPCRKWHGGTYYINRADSCVYRYASNGTKVNCKKIVDLTKYLGFHKSAVLHNYKKHVVIVGKFENGDGHAMLIDLTNNKKVTHSLPHLPSPVFNVGIGMSDNDVYVIGGRTENVNSLSSVYCLPFGNDRWMIKSSMPTARTHLLVIQHSESIYVLGGYSQGQGCLTSVLVYNLANDRWHNCKDMPIACDSDNADVVEHDGKIKVVTADACMVYEDNTDTWSVERYNELGDSAKVFTHKGQICASVPSEYFTNLKVYDEVRNTWTTKTKILKVYMYRQLKNGLIILGVFMFLWVLIIVNWPYEKYFACVQQCEKLYN